MTNKNKMVYHPPTGGRTWLGANLVLSWPTNAGIFNIQSTTQISPSAWADLIPQPALQVHGALYEAALPMDDRQKFFRLAQ